MQTEVNNVLKTKKHEEMIKNEKLPTIYILDSKHLAATTTGNEALHVISAFALAGTTVGDCN